MPLSDSQRRHLRGLAHHLKPVVMVGQDGLKASVLAEVDAALTDHELIKVKVAAADRERTRRTDCRDRSDRRGRRSSSRSATWRRCSAATRRNHGSPFPADRTPGRRRSRRVTRTGPRALELGSPPGAGPLTTSPSALPISARAIGELTEIRPSLDVGLVLADDLVGVLLVRGRRPAPRPSRRRRPARRLEGPDVDDLGVRQLGLDVLDAALDEALLLAWRRGTRRSRSGRRARAPRRSP